MKVGSSSAEHTVHDSQGIETEQDRTSPGNFPFLSTESRMPEGLEKLETGQLRSGYESKERPIEMEVPDKSESRLDI